MTIPVMALLTGAALMALSGDSIHVEPGKQLPQAVRIHAAGPHDGDVTVRYLLFTPQGYRADGKKWPLLLFLHGLGECSHDDLSRVKIHGPAKIVDSRPDFPLILVTPQCPPPTGHAPGKKYTTEEAIELVGKAWKPAELIQLVDHVAKKLNVDPARIYVTGLSMGGYGTWRLAAAYPDRFAAALPVCGGGEPDVMAKALARVPIWAFHGAKDPTVPLSESEKMVDAVKRAGGDVQLTVYPDVEHNSWAPTYDNPKVYEWLLSHQRK
jgi:predicted peptidase